ARTRPLFLYEVGSGAMTPATLRKVLLLSEPYPPGNPGGAGKYAQTVARSLVERGYSVDVVCADSTAGGVETDHGVRIIRTQVAKTAVGISAASLKERRDRILPVLRNLHGVERYDLIHDIGGFLYSEAFSSFVRVACI